MARRLLWRKDYQHWHQHRSVTARAISSDLTAHSSPVLSCPVPSRGVAAKVINKVEMSTHMVTSACFGGIELNELFVTTSNRGLSSGQSGPQEAGHTFKVTCFRDNSFKGFASNPFKQFWTAKSLTLLCVNSESRSDLEVSLSTLSITQSLYSSEIQYFQCDRHWHEVRGQRQFRPIQVVLVRLLFYFYFNYWSLK